MNKEEIYDAEIAPLMAQIIDICNRHSIAMLASFHLPIPTDSGLYCTTALLGRNAPDSLRKAMAVIVDGHAVLNPETIVYRDMN